MHDLSLDIANLRRLYRERALTPSALVEQLYARLEGEDARRIWITRLTREQLLEPLVRGHDAIALPLRKAYEHYAHKQDAEARSTVPQR